MPALQAAPPPSPAAARRNHIISVRLTPEEYRRLAQHAAADRRSLGSCCRVAVLDMLDGAEG